MPKNKQFDEGEALAKAREIFHQKGYNGTSMDELVQATGLSRSSIYDTFGDKHSLYLKTLEQYKVQANCALDDELGKIDSPRKRIFTFFNHAIEEIVSDRDRKGCFMVNAAAELASEDKKVSSMASANMEEMETKLYGWIKEAQDLNEISKTHSARSLARHLYNTVTGLRITGKTKPDKVLMKDIVKVSLSILDI